MNAPSREDWLIDGPGQGPTIALAHGAGAPMDSPFMNAMAAGLAQEGFRVVRFEFPYMHQRRASGRSRPPDKEPVLRKAWHDVIDALEAKRLVIGGKSMGGRMASLVAEEAGVAGLVCLGYPFHPARKPQQLRVEHLRTLQTPTIIVQGERDPFGSRGEAASYELSQRIRMHWLVDGDHSFKPRKASGRTEQQNWEEAIRVAAEFARSMKTGGESHSFRRP